MLSQLIGFSVGQAGSMTSQTLRVTPVFDQMTGPLPLPAPYKIKRKTIEYVTKNSVGTPVAGVTVDAFRTADDGKFDTQVSDGSGNVMFSVYDDLNYYLRGYLAGAPDTAGTTVDNVTGVPV